MRTAPLLLSAAMLAAAPATASAADVVIDGRGWGHGIGMSQYGAYGYALREGRDHRFILEHYYTGTTLGDAPGTRLRVLLQASRAPSVSGATAASSPGRRIRLSANHTYRFSPARGGRLAVTDVRTGRRRARLGGPVTLSGGATTRLRGLAQNGVTNGLYRGRMVLSRSGGSVLAVNNVGLEPYLFGVVPAEMPSSWPAEALKAQAVVARSYALTSGRGGSAFDVYADVRSQVYRGVTGEMSTTNDAVRATRGRVVLAGGAVAQTFFFSTSGGRTAGNEEEWGGTPLLVPATGRRPARRPVAVPHVAGAVLARPGREPPARLHAREVPAAAGALPHHLGARGDALGRRPGRHDRDLRCHRSRPVRAAEQLDHPHHGSVSHPTAVRVTPTDPARFETGRTTTACCSPPWRSLSTATADLR